MRWPGIAATTAVVALMHAGVLLDPWHWLPTPSVRPPALPAVVMAELLAAPAIAPAPLPPPSALPLPKTSPPKRQRPHRVVPPEPAVHTPMPAAAAPAPEPPANELAALMAPEPVAENADTANATNNASTRPDAQTDAQPHSTPPPTVPAPSHPAPDQLQVRDVQGHAQAFALPTDGSALSQSMELRFKVHGFVKGLEYHAKAVLQWQTDGASYQAHQSISAFLLGSLEQRSQGHLGPQGLQPVRFEDRRLAKQRHVDFIWERGHALFEPVRDPAPIGTGTQDRLSVFLQLASMLNALPALRAPGTQIDIPTMGSRRLQTWLFVVQASETLELPAGNFHTLRLQRMPQPQDDETTEIWLAPALGFVPVRIRMQEANGDHLDLVLTEQHSTS